MSLSRELIRWLQSLDLSVQVKNPRRDLANGFVVAEIFSCYYPSDVEMYAYENATSMPRKQANWELLFKFFRRSDVPITRQMIDDTLHTRTPEAAVQLLKAAYTFLTNKTPTKAKTGQAPAAAATAPSQEGASVAVPAFAKPTASTLLKEMGEQDLKGAKVMALIEEHDRAQWAEREKKGEVPINTLVGQPARGSPTA
jgi:hypothetical protein